MPRIAAVDMKNSGLANRMMARFAEKRYGKTLDPLAVTAHHKGLLRATVVHELMVERAGSVLPEAVRELVVYRAAVRLGCSWCVDFGTMLQIHQGLDVERLEHIDEYPTSDLFSRQERLALAYADAMTATPVEVTDAQVAELEAEFGPAGVVELTYHIALENMRARSNSALGIPAQGFTESCQVPVGD
ncbi:MULTISPECIES: carboxymuconolactone decarboxylase family protein [Thermocrispum]|jgi:AhpD family alkylhydroperoxidase|uniref:Carboxymuconolactone decarboxylase family protein n=1 Tax=Thermocrispum agreste TaxID=37925 RepID=A0A2W4LEF9_9PSEU|nr:MULTISPECIES: carboxymuconolactone decarboxylase family protein [Thermocrispum]PZM99429.1 MAG: carboxymuconolactone decarboxylase family protein [Thermocrispum agreste]